MIRPAPVDVTTIPMVTGTRSSPDAVALEPLTTCKNSGMNMTAPNMATPTSRIMPLPTEKALFWNRERGSMGSAALLSRQRNRPTKASVVKAKPTMTGDPQR